MGLTGSLVAWNVTDITDITDPKEIDWNDMAYGKTDWTNFSISVLNGNGIGSIVTKKEPVSAPFQGLTYGWATGLGHNSDFYGYWPYEYTNSYLCSGGINVGFACAPADQYCICGGNAPNNCVLNKVVNTCSCYTPKYPSLGPTMVLPKFYQKYGWFEIRCKAPRGKKMWSAFWAVNKGYYPAEIDFFEIEGNGKTMLSNIYYEDCIGPNAQGEDPPGNANYYTYARGYRYYDDFYTYACEWGPTYIKWYLNNELIATETAPDRMQHDPFWIMVNTGVINVRAGCEPEIFPNYFDIDYIRIYQNPAWQ